MLYRYPLWLVINPHFRPNHLSSKERRLLLGPHVLARWHDVQMFRSCATLQPLTLWEAAWRCQMDMGQGTHMMNQYDGNMEMIEYNREYNRIMWIGHWFKFMEMIYHDRINEVWGYIWMGIPQILQKVDCWWRSPDIPRPFCWCFRWTAGPEVTHSHMAASCTQNATWLSSLNHFGASAASHRFGGVQDTMGDPQTMVWIFLDNVGVPPFSLGNLHWSSHCFESFGWADEDFGHCTAQNNVRFMAFNGPYMVETPGCSGEEKSGTPKHSLTLIPVEKQKTRVAVPKICCLPRGSISHELAWFKIWWLESSPQDLTMFSGDVRCYSTYYNAAYGMRCPFWCSCVIYLNYTCHHSHWCLMTWIWPI